MEHSKSVVDDCDYAFSQTAEEFIKHDFDFVIIGGGTAGLCVAARLSEIPDVTVGVLEAGQNKLGDPIVDTPATFSQTFNNSDYDWAFKTEPQTMNKGVRHHVPRGKLLGGSSGINYMMYVRGSLQDYDDWAIITGDRTWGSETMKRYMLKHQMLEPVDETVIHRKAIPFVGENHGTSGPVHTSFNDCFLPIEDSFLQACDEVTGITQKPIDPWSGDHLGFFNTLGTVVRTGPDKGKRSYAAQSYLTPVAKRRNLHVLCEAMVTTIKLENTTAVGINFAWQSKSYSVDVNHEIILSCGAIQTPQVLELSGIGDPDVLNDAGVPCKIINKAVGNNLQDHVMTSVGWELAPGNATLETIYDPAVLREAQQQLAEHKRGPLTAISSTQGFFPYKPEQDSILRTVESSLAEVSPFQRRQYKQTIEHLKDEKSANLQFVLIPHTADYANGIEDQSKLFPPLKSGRPMGAVAAVSLQYPLSRGSVHIKSSDPYEHPALDPAFLTHPADVSILAAGIKMLDAITKSKSLEGKIARRTQPADPSVDLTKTSQAEAAVRDLVLSEYHPVGSCAMGDALDTRLRVRGVQHLRVVDASVFPNHLSGNCVSSVYAVAERAADLIKEDWSMVI